MTWHASQYTHLERRLKQLRCALQQLLIHLLQLLVGSRVDACEAAHVLGLVLFPLLQHLLPAAQRCPAHRTHDRACTCLCVCVCVRVCMPVRKQIWRPCLGRQWLGCAHPHQHLLALNACELLPPICPYWVRGQANPHTQVHAHVHPAMKCCTRHCDMLHASS